jgi:hypothetical protein
MFLTIFAFGTVAFWILVALFVIVEIICTETTSPVAGAVWLALFLCILQLGGSIPVVQWFAANPGRALLALVVYFVVGAAWSVFKWTTLCLAVASYVRVLKEEFDHPTENRNERYTWRDRLRNSGDYKGVDLMSLPPRVAAYKERIITWMVWWPTSMVWTILDDFVKNVFNHVYNAIRSTLQGISNRIFKDIEVGS